MSTYVQKTNGGVLLANSPTSVDDVPASTKALYHRVLLENLGYFPARAWVWKMPTSTAPVPFNHDLRSDGDVNLVHSDSDLYSLALALPLATRQRINIIEGSQTLQEASAYLYAMTDYADYGVAGSTQVFYTAEISATAGNCSYTSTTAVDSSNPFTASANNADCVGRRVENGNAYLIVTSNTTGTLTGTDGWRDKRTGLVATTPTNATAFKVLASARDIRETTLPVNLYAGHLFNANGKTGRIVGNNAGIATYGTTFQILLGGWSGGTPANDSAWQIDNLVRLTLDWIEES